MNSFSNSSMEYFNYTTTLPLEDFTSYNALKNDSTPLALSSEKEVASTKFMALWYLVAILAIIAFIIGLNAVYVKYSEQETPKKINSASDNANLKRKVHRRTLAARAHIIPRSKSHTRRATVKLKAFENKRQNHSEDHLAFTSLPILWSAIAASSEYSYKETMGRRSGSLKVCLAEVPQTVLDTIKEESSSKERSSAGTVNKSSIAPSETCNESSIVPAETFDKSAINGDL